MLVMLIVICYTIVIKIDSLVTRAVAIVIAQDVELSRVAVQYVHRILITWLPYAKISLLAMIWKLF